MKYKRPGIAGFFINGLKNNEHVIPKNKPVACLFGISII